MARIVLVRHGRAASGWDAPGDPDPGLDDVGVAQAEAMAGALGPLGPLPVIVSPLRRTRETAAALERRWGVGAVVEPAVAEIPSPSDDPVVRGPWLRELVRGTWRAGAPELRGWCDGVIGALLALPGDAIVVTHFVAINVAVGRATGDDRVVCFAPGNCSQTVLDSDGGALRVVSRGAEDAITIVR